MSASVYMINASLHERIAKCESLKAENAVPVVVEQAGAGNGKVQFAALPATATVAQLEAAVRRVAGVSEKKPLTLVVAGCNMSATATLGDLAGLCKQQDGLLYVQYGTERTMGGCGVDSMCGTCSC